MRAARLANLPEAVHACPLSTRARPSSIALLTCLTFRSRTPISGHLNGHQRDLSSIVHPPWTPWTPAARCVQRRPILTPPLAIMTRSMSSPCARCEEWSLAALLRRLRFRAPVACGAGGSGEMRDRTRELRSWRRARTRSEARARLYCQRTEWSVRTRDMQTCRDAADSVQLVCSARWRCST